jgi:hypothetical protein
MPLDFRLRGNDEIKDAMENNDLNCSIVYDTLLQKYQSMLGSDLNHECQKMIIRRAKMPCFSQREVDIIKRILRLKDGVRTSCPQSKSPSWVAAGTCAIMLSGFLASMMRSSLRSVM